jgi:hypothetical protein
MKTTNTNILLSQLLQRLEEQEKVPLSKKVFVGFDGFIDRIKKPVRRRNEGEIVYYETLGEFAERIRQAAGKSGQIELITKKIKVGGNAPILAHALGKLGVASYCAGSMGSPQLHPLFSEINSNCKKISLLNPGESDAVEFNDGKMIFSQLSVFENYNWNYIKTSAKMSGIRKAVMGSTLLAFVDWVNLPLSSNIWDGVLHDIIRPSGRKDFIFLFDLCDPSKKTVLQIDQVLDLISSFSPYGKVTLGLNENETIKIWCAIHGVDADKSKIPTVEAAGDSVFKSMDIDCLLVHPIDRVIAYRKNQVLEVQGRLVINPKVLTGGGDNLNAGYCLGLLRSLPFEQCILLGIAASGSYIENGESSDINAIVKYLETWRKEMSLATTKSHESHV